MLPAECNNCRILDNGRLPACAEWSLIRVRAVYRSSSLQNHAFGTGEEQMTERDLLANCVI
jgi:hypothetical protein